MLRLAKYHGLGNDFLLLDRRTSGNGAVAPGLAVRLCHRRRGVGADGVLTILPSTAASARMHVTNSDGSVAEMCGNGIRCVAKYLADEGGISGDTLAIETGAGVKVCRLFRGADGRVAEVEVEMGAPRLAPRDIPLAASGERFVRGEVGLLGQSLRGTAVSMGNPHLVLFGEVPEEAAALGPALERHPLFPNRTNVEFASPRADGGFDVTVWERGCGFTDACGTGACAVAVAAVLEGRSAEGEERVVHLPGGPLAIRVAPSLSGVSMRGPAERVCSVEVEE